MKLTLRRLHCSVHCDARLKGLILVAGARRISIRQIQEAGRVGHNNNSTMLHSVEAATLSADTAIATANEQHEPDMHRLAFGSEIPTRSLAALKEYFPSMEGELCDATNYF